RQRQIRKWADDRRLRRARRSFGNFTGGVLARRPALERRVSDRRGGRFEERALPDRRRGGAWRAGAGAASYRRDGQRGERARRRARTPLTRGGFRRAGYSVAPGDVSAARATRLVLAAGCIGRSTSTALVFARTVILVTSHTMPSAGSGAPSLQPGSMRA